MSDEEQQTEAGNEGAVPLDLSSLEFGPAWARGGGEEDKKKEKQQKAWADREERGGKGRGAGGRRNDRRGGGGPGGGGRREDRRGGGRDDQRGRGRRGDGKFERREQRREEVPAPEGITAQIMPVEEGLDSLAREILAAGRTYAVFDLAKLVLGARERFNVGFQCEGDRKLYRCRKDGSVWLNKEEALQGFWQGEWKKDFYEEVVTTGEPPKGNFQSVAKCGLSGEYLGPPNYHGYQPAIVQMHRERFGHMSLDNYKRKIQMVHGEEAVAAWLEQMTQQKRYRPTGGKTADETPEGEDAAATEAEGDAPAAGAEAPAEAAPESEAPVTAEPIAEETASEEPATEVAPTEEAAPEDAATEDAATEDEAPADGEATAEGDAEPAEASEASEAPDSAAGGEELLEDLRAVERHFLEHHFAEVFQHTAKAWVPGGVPGNLLSPGLLTLLRHTVAEERRYPGRLTPILCRQLSGRHVAVFKWRKKLKAGPARPHQIPDNIVLADRPQQLLAWLKENSGKSLKELWEDLLPEGSGDEVKHAWYHDLHWVLNQGYALLLSDSTLHLARRKEAAKKTAAGKEEPPKEAATPAKPPKDGATPAEAPSKDEATPETPAATEAPAASGTAEAHPAVTPETAGPEESVTAQESPGAAEPATPDPAPEAGDPDPPVGESAPDEAAPGPPKPGGSES